MSEVRFQSPPSPRDLTKASSLHASDHRDLQHPVNVERETFARRQRNRLDAKRRRFQKKHGGTYQQVSTSDNTGNGHSPSPCYSAEESWVTESSDSEHHLVIEMNPDAIQNTAVNSDEALSDDTLSLHQPVTPFEEARLRYHRQPVKADWTPRRSTPRDQNQSLDSKTGDTTADTVLQALPVKVPHVSSIRSHVEETTSSTSSGGHDEGGLYPKAFAMQQGRFGEDAWLSELQAERLCQAPRPPPLAPPCPRPLLLVKKTLGQAGVPVEHSATTSATVGTALTYAMSVTAAAPAVAMGYAASQLAVQARVVLGQQSDFARACESLGRQARRKAKADKGHEDDTIMVGSFTAGAHAYHDGGGGHEPQAEIHGRACSVHPSTLRARGAGLAATSVPPPPLGSTNNEVVVELGSIRKDVTDFRPRSSEFFMTPDGGTDQGSPPPPEDIQKVFLATARLEVQVAARDVIVSYSRSLSRAKDGTPCQTNVALRFCRNCMKYQPLRTKHCSECGKCVRTMDHHCPWLGSCVGENNRFWFFWFLIAQTVELSWALVEGVRGFNGAQNLSIDNTNVGKVIFLSIYLALVFIVMICLLIMVLCLIGYHMFLATSNITTWENIAWGHISYLRELPEKYGSPFSRGILANLYVYCCPPQIPGIRWLRRFCMPHPAHIPLYGPENELIWEHENLQTRTTMDALTQSLSNRVSLVRSVYCELDSTSKAANSATDRDTKLREKWKYFLDLLSADEHQLNLLDARIACLNNEGIPSIAARDDAGLADAIAELDQATFARFVDGNSSVTAPAPGLQRPSTLHPSYTTNAHNCPSLMSDPWTAPAPQYSPLAESQSVLGQSCLITSRHTLTSSRLPYGTSRLSLAEKQPHSAGYLELQSVQHDDLSYDTDDLMPDLQQPHRSVPLRRTRDCQMPVPISPVTPKEWEALPAHVRSRLSLQRIHGAVMDINTFLDKKYRIINTPMWQLSRSNDLLSLSKHFLDAETLESRSLFWFSESDIRLFERSTFRVDSTGSVRQLKTVYPGVQESRFSMRSVTLDVW